MSKNLRNLLFGRIYLNNWPQMKLVREIIQKVVYFIGLITQIIVYYVYIDKNTPIELVVGGIFFNSLSVYCFSLTFNHFLFSRNYFYAIYGLVSLVVFNLLTIPIISEPYYVSTFVPIKHFLVILVTTSSIGFLVPIILSLVFKTIHHILLDSIVLYYDYDLVKLLDSKHDSKQKQNEQPVQSETKLKEKSSITIYDTMNETQLKVELNLAIKEDRFEDAQKIKNILENKFR